MKRKKQPIPPSLSPAALALIAGRFKVLADPTRLALLHTLHDGELSVGALVDRTGGNQANVSKHLAVLMSAGMVSRRKEGNFAYYAISDSAVFEICELVCSKMAGRFLADAQTLTRAPAR